MKYLAILVVLVLTSLPIWGSEIDRLLNLASRGHVESQFELGEIYRTGNGVAQDYLIAVKWYIRAAKKGHHTASNYLQQWYDSGVDAYNEGDDATALQRMLLLAKNGATDAQFYVGMIYHTTFSIGKPYDASNYQEAVKWYTLAGNNGHRQAQNNLGMFYRLGMTGVEKDPVAAIKWYRMAAKQGDEEAQYYLRVLTGQ